ncbi:MAG: alpha/beta hydrolase [Micrococcales bacterium]|nr:alpha/beta hydrolase [Micrococcales bacterium]
MKAFRRFMFRALLAGILSFLIVPFLIPFNSSGTLTASQAAPGAEFVQLNDLSVRVERTAYSGNCRCQAPLIVLMHGFGASTFSWRNVRKPFSKLGEVISYDRPGFGYTERKTSWEGTNPYGFQGNFSILDDLIAKYGTGRKIVLVGHSAGGQLAAEYARLNPTKVSALVLVDAAIWTTGGGPNGFDWFFALPQMQKLGPILVSSIATSGDDLLRKSYYDKKKLTQDVYDGYHQPLKIKGWEQAFWFFSTAPRSNQLKENLASLKLPTLIITGEFDAVVPARDAPILHKKIANSVLEIIPKATHLPQEEQPELFMSAVLKHWKELAKN